ncbi:hypothetical protein AVEN_37028-1 [Araneus ventricosus]|uniref:Uncharacterized protein n=1 Tax=Araneus ventricosus TaxID=182803 RepID=A0A4Y2VNA8_ARAVE|nr:hypothetical protein AVEN_99972-1 [Araneus ventricosus]GBO25670.1 hypothetical protein AVEN_37028-1 [Araneus ventricosus]
MPGDEVIGGSFQTFLFEVWHWLLHMPRHCENTLREVPCQFHHNCNNRRQTGETFEVGNERAMLKEEDNIPISTRCSTILLRYPHDIVRYSEYRITS